NNFPVIILQQLLWFKPRGAETEYGFGLLVVQKFVRSAPGDLDWRACARLRRLRNVSAIASSLWRQKLEPKMAMEQAKTQRCEAEAQRVVSRNCGVPFSPRC